MVKFIGAVGIITVVASSFIVLFGNLDLDDEMTFMCAILVGFGIFFLSGIFNGLVGLIRYYSQR